MYSHSAEVGFRFVAPVTFVCCSSYCCESVVKHYVNTAVLHALKLHFSAKIYGGGISLCLNVNGPLFWSSYNQTE